MTPIRVAVTGAAGQIAYALLPRIAAGALFGPDQPVILQLLEITPALKTLQGVRMELDDLAPPTLHDVVCTDDPEVGFGDADVIFLIGGRPRGKGMLRKDLIAINGPIFEGQGKAIGKSAKRSVKLVTVANPCNSNALVTAHHAAGIDPKQITAMTRLDHHRALSQLAQKAGVQVGKVQNVTIWGNHSATQYPDAHTALIDGNPAYECLDQSWLESEFISTVAGRGKAIIEARGHSSATSAAHAALSHMKTWIEGTAEGVHVSMAVASDGSYGVPEGLVSSFPVTCKDGAWSIVPGLELDDFAKGKIAATVQELQNEREAVKGLLS